MAWLVDRLLCKHEGMLSDPQHPCEVQPGRSGKTDEFAGSLCRSSQCGHIKEISFFCLSLFGKLALLIG